jgi:hypothetical protein
MEKNTKRVATIANLLEIGKRVILRQKSESIQIPRTDNDGFEMNNTDLGKRITDDLGAALLRAINEKAAEEGVINAQ